MLFNLIANIQILTSLFCARKPLILRPATN